MPILPANQPFVDAYFAAIQPVENAYCDVRLSYLALRSGAQFEIIRARVAFNTSPFDPPLPNFVSPNVSAGQYRLTDLKTDVRSLIASLNSGEIKTPDGELRFPEGSGGYYTATFVPFHQDGLQTQTRVAFRAEPIVVLIGNRTARPRCRRRCVVRTGQRAGGRRRCRRR
jgi:hypothetical protein